MSVVTPAVSSEGEPAKTGEAEVRRLLAADKCKQAVELAKEIHKKQNTPESRRLLVEAYIARIAQFQAKGMPKEAQTILDLIKERFPEERHLLGGAEVRAAAAVGRLDDLLRPLASDDIPAETRTLIETTIARHITDLPGIAACEVLPESHPLRTGAAAVWKAFIAVTTGPVTDEQIALPDISRRCPLAAWKLVIRAIVLFYRKNDADCRRTLDSIPADSAVAPVVAAVRVLVDGVKPTAGISAVLYSRVLAEDTQLRMALERVERYMGGDDTDRLVGAIQGAVAECAQTRPELLERVRQHIAVVAAVAHVPTTVVERATGFFPRNASYWRLFAVAFEPDPLRGLAAMAWERFLRHAIAEGRFGESSAEAAGVWMHITAGLALLPLEKLERQRKRLSGMSLFTDSYQNQPPEIARLAPKSDKALADLVLEPGRWFLEATKIRPEAKLFQGWLNWAGSVGLSDKQTEGIAQHWHKGLPRDVKPLVLLSSMAESRKAFALALKRLDEAERIDPMNQSVRQARVRLLMAVAWRHFADKKPHLVEKDLADLALLPAMNEGDRSAVLESMRGAMHALRKDDAAGAASRAIVAEKMGDLAGPVVFESIKIMARQQTIKGLGVPGKTTATPLEIVRAQARTIRLADDLRLQIYRPHDWASAAGKIFKERPSPLTAAEIILLGRGAVSMGNRALAYAATAAGLSRNESASVTARLLLLRSLSFPRYGAENRKTQCMRGALELARQANDEGLIKEVLHEIDLEANTRFSLFNDDKGPGRPIGPEVLQWVLEQEMKATKYPVKQWDIDQFVVPDAVETERNIFGGFGPDFGHDDYDDDELYDDDDDDGDYDDDDTPVGSEYDDEGGEDDDAGSPIPGDIGPEDLEQMKEIIRQMGAISPEELANNPDKMIEAMSKVLGKKLNALERALVASQIKKLIAGGIAGGLPGKKNGKKGNG
jgi:hypothetical protein